MKSNTEPNIIARTGRVQQWIDNPTSRLPVSCTIFVVEDSMEGVMELKQAGVLLAMLSALERESQSTCRNLDQREQKL